MYSVQGKCGKLIEQLLSTFSLLLGEIAFMTMGSGLTYVLRLVVLVVVPDGDGEALLRQVRDIRHEHELEKRDTNPHSVTSLKHLTNDNTGAERLSC